MRRIFLVPALLLLFLSQEGWASAFYTEAGFTYGSIKIDNVHFEPAMLRGKFGYNLTQFAATEFVIASSVKSDDTKGTEIDPVSIAAMYLRYGGSIRQRSRAYLLFGLATTKLEQVTVESKSIEDYNDASIGFGMEEQITDYKNIQITFEYTQYYNRKEISIRGFNLGIRADF